ncbi:DUF2378 family protein [Pyxidicoccus sp. 3LG]
MTSAPPPTPRIRQGNFFVALFTNGLRVKEPLIAALRQVGFDVDRPQGEYPIEVWNECMRLAWRHLCPAKSQEQAYREFGRRFFEGFTQTLIGSVLSVGLPVLGAERFLRRLPQYMKIDTLRYRVEAHEVEPRHWRLVFRDDLDAKPDFVAGIVEASLLRIGTQAAVDVTLREPTNFDITVRW